MRRRYKAAIYAVVIPVTMLISYHHTTSGVVQANHQERSPPNQVKIASPWHFKKTPQAPSVPYLLPTATYMTIRSSTWRLQ